MNEMQLNGRNDKNEGKSKIINKGIERGQQKQNSERKRRIVILFEI